MNNVIVYIHGKGGNADEARHFRRFFPDCDVIGFDYRSQTPGEASEEFPAYFEWGSSGAEPIPDSMDLGLMLYDVFDLHKWKVGKNAEPFVSLYRPQMVNGVIEVPPFDSPLVIKPGTEGRD
mgnify:CR=1 FL=1